MAKTAEEISGDVVFMLTDVEGSTRLWEDDPEAMRRALARHDGILNREVSRARGQLLQSRSEGDSAFAVFSDPAAALDAAVSIQRSLGEEEWPTKSPLLLRIGLHVGNAAGEGDYFGPAVNRCARLRDLGHGGQTLLSADLARALNGRDVTPATFRDLGEFALRGIEGAMRVFQVCHPRLPDEFPQIALAPGSAHNLPAESTRFFGREEQLAALRQLLATTRLVTLTGPGGVGKTRLALRAARDSLAEFPDGVRLIDLGALTDGRLVANVVAKTLRVREEPGRPVADVLIAHLARRRMLLVLDNCEHIVGECAAFANDLLTASAWVMILATSRESLRVAGEKTVVVPPLELGGEASESVRLFVDRAALVGADVTASSEASGICADLDGLPLAIELAASWTSMLSLAEISRGLADRFRLLEAGPRSSDPRHQTLRASVDWSCALLEPNELILFRRLSIFAGSFSLDEVKNVCCIEPLEPLEALRTLAGLVRKSLVTVTRTTEPARYRLLETLRRYGAERLDDAGEAEQIRARLIDHVVSLVEEAEPHLTSADQRMWTSRLDDERDNIRAILEWCRREGKGEPLTRIAGAMALYWTNSSHYEEARLWLDAAGENEAGSEAAIARARWARGFVSVYQFDIGSAYGPLTQALETFRSLGDIRGSARSLGWLGYVAAFAGGPPAARPLLDEGIELARAAGDRWALVVGLVGRGLFTSTCTDARAARAFFMEAVEVARELGAASLFAAALTMEATGDFYAGEYYRARKGLQEALAVATTAGSSFYATHAIGFLAGVLDQMGAHDEARATLGQLGSVEVRHISAATALWWESRIELHTGNLAQAGALIRDGLAAPIASLPMTGSLFRHQLADVLIAQGEPAEAVGVLEEALNICRMIEGRYVEARCLLSLSRARLALGDPAGALESLAASAEIAPLFGDLATIVDILEWAARLAFDGGDASDAAKLIGAAAKIRTACGYVHPRFDPSGHDELVEVVEERLGRDPEERERQAGEELSELEALALAISASASR